MPRGVYQREKRAPNPLAGVKGPPLHGLLRRRYGENVSTGVLLVARHGATNVLVTKEDGMYCPLRYLDFVASGQRRPLSVAFGLDIMGLDGSFPIKDLYGFSWRVRSVRCWSSSLDLLRRDRAEYVPLRELNQDNLIGGYFTKNLLHVCISMRDRDRLDADRSRSRDQDLTLLLSSAVNEREVVSALYDLIHLRCYWSQEEQLASVLQDFVTSHPEYCEVTMRSVTAYMGDCQSRREIMRASRLAREAGLRYGRRTARPLVIGFFSGDTEDDN